MGWREGWGSGLTPRTAMAWVGNQRAHSSHWIFAGKIAGRRQKAFSVESTWLLLDLLYKIRQKVADPGRFSVRASPAIESQRRTILAQRVVESATGEIPDHPAG